MKICVSLSKNNKELASNTADVSQPGDLTNLIGLTFDEARSKFDAPLWDFELTVREA
jgi:hypothetical protein